MTTKSSKDQPAACQVAMNALPGLSQAYHAFDQNAACERGWCLNEYGDGMIGIVKDDENDTFAGSDEAHEHVAFAAISSAEPAYRVLCAQALVIEAASIALRDALNDGNEED